MFHKINQLKAGVVLSYISTALGFVINLTYTPVMIRLLGQSEYGLYTLVGSFVSYLSLFSLGFAGSYLRFFARYKSRDDEKGEAKLNGVFIVLFLLMSLMAFVSGMILAQFTSEIFGGKLTVEELEKSKILMQILVINIAMTFPATVFDSIVSAHEKFVFQRLVNILGQVCNPFICLPLLLMGYGAVAMVIVISCITAIKLLVNVFYCIHVIKAPFSFCHFDFDLVKEMGAFSFFIFLNMIIDQINWSVDKFILGKVSGTTSVSIYGVGASINSIFISLSTVVSSVFCPRVNMIENGAGTEEEKNRSLSDLLTKVGRIQYMLVLMIMLGFIFAGRSFLIWWVGIEYKDAYYVALFLTVMLVVYLPHNLGIEIRRAKNKHQKAAVILFFTALVNCLISIPLAIKYGAIGAAFGTFLGNVVNMIWLDQYYIKDVHINIKQLYNNLLQISVSVIPAIIFALVGLFFNSLWINLIWACGFVMIYAILLYKYGMNQWEKSTVNNVLNRIRRK